jgi:hypothetical protein
MTIYGSMSVSHNFREPTIGKWFHSQKANLRNMVKKDEVYANNLARLIAAARKKTTPFSHIIK